MANDETETVNFDNFFKEFLPSFFQQAYRNLHSEDLNCLEYFERRLGDHAYVLRCFILHVKNTQPATIFYDYSIFCMKMLLI